MKKDRSDFRNWLSYNVNWKEVAFLLNIGKEYQHKQDLIAVFWNGYIYYQQKFEEYFKEFNKIPLEVFNELIFEFRQSFPKHGRTDGVNYFDDLIEQLIKHYITERKEDVKIWSKQNQPIITGDSYKISNLLKSGSQIDHPFLKNDMWTKEGKQRGTDFIRMIVENISKLKIEGTPQNYLLIAKAHGVQVANKSIRNVMKEGMKAERKRNKSGT